MKTRLLIVAALAAGIAGCRAPSAVITRRPLETKAGVPLAPPDKVRIGIRVGVDEASVADDQPITALEATSGRVETWPPGKYLFAAKDGIVTINGKSRGGAWRLKSAADGVLLQCGQNIYRGVLIVKAAPDGKVNVINELDIDDYLKGVLPREAVVTWPDETLKTQAVASRTYLAAHLNRHASEGFDLCADVHCQVYGGATKEHPRTNAAVDATRGEILVYNGHPISAFFCANCGGSTEKVSAVWGEADQPYLQRKRCEWDGGAPWYNWRTNLSDETILNGLKAAKLVQGSRLRSVAIAMRSGSRRAQKMVVRTNAGTYTMLGNAFRIALNPEKIRSTLFTSITRLHGAYLFQGRGWGHGIGLCQWGAKGLAERGRDYRYILAYYYPGAEFSTWSRK